MTTLAHPITMGIARAWDGYYPSAVFSGIVGDADHRRRNSYHNSIEDNPDKNGYSTSRPDDKAPPGDWPRNLAAAIDMSMNPQDMKTCSSRLWDVWNDTSDPRRIYLNGFNGWFNDGGPAKRYDFVSGAISETTSDHKWHVHLEIRRKYVTSTIAAEAIKSILRGETKAQYLTGIAQRGIEDMYAKHGMGTNGAPVSHDTMYLQGQMRFLVEMEPSYASRLPEHPLTVDGAYGNQTAYWVSVILTGGEGTEVNGAWFGVLDRKVASQLIALEIAKLPPPPVFPEQVRMVIPATVIPVPETTITVDVSPV